MTKYLYTENLWLTIYEDLCIVYIIHIYYPSLSVTKQVLYYDTMNRDFTFGVFTHCTSKNTAHHALNEIQQ